MLLLALLAAALLAPAAAMASEPQEGVSINAENFPDENFRQYVKKFDTNGNDSLSPQEIADAKEIEVVNKSISDLTGIEYFTALTSLYCSGNQLTELDVSKNTKLTDLYCNNNDLTSLNVSGCTKLTSLNCSSNRLTSLDVSGCTALTNLTCSSNHLTSLE